MLEGEHELVVCPLFLDRQPGWRRPAGLKSSDDVGGCKSRKVHMNADQFRSCLFGHLIRYECTPVAALCDESTIPEAFHQSDPGAGDPLRAPAAASRLSGKPVARHRRNNDVERVRGGAAISGGIGERSNDL